MKLTEIKRQDDPIFISFLNRLRDDKVNENDCKMINEICSIDGIFVREGENGLKKFTDEECIKFFINNQLCLKHNSKC